MQKLVTVKELFKETEKYIDRTISVGGWVRSIRDSKTFGFMIVHDGTFFETLQVVFHDQMENFEEVAHLNVGTAVIVTGKLVATPQAKQPLRSRPIRSRWKAHRPRIIRCRKSATVWSSCARCRIFARGQIRSRRLSACAR